MTNTSSANYGIENALLYSMKRETTQSGGNNAAANNASSRRLGNMKHANATLGATHNEIATMKIATIKLSAQAELILKTIKDNGSLNDKASESLGIKTYKEQGILIARIGIEIAKAFPNTSFTDFCKAFGELPADIRNAIDYGRSCFPQIAAGKITEAEKAIKKSELHSKLSALEKADSIRKNLFAIANGDTKRILQIANMTSADLILHETELIKK